METVLILGVLALVVLGVLAHASYVLIRSLVNKRRFARMNQRLNRL